MGARGVTMAESVTVDTFDDVKRSAALDPFGTVKSSMLEAGALESIDFAYLERIYEDYIRQSNFNRVFIDLATRNTRWPGVVHDENSYDTERTAIQLRTFDVEFRDENEKNSIRSIMLACMKRLETEYGKFKPKGVTKRLRPADVERESSLRLRMHL